jgi:hypothetical protein
VSLLILANRLFGLRTQLAIYRARVKSSLFQALLRLPDLPRTHFLLAMPLLLLHMSARAAPTGSRLTTLGTLLCPWRPRAVSFC